MIPENLSQDKIMDNKPTCKYADKGCNHSEVCDQYKYMNCGVYKYFEFLESEYGRK